MVGTSIEHTTTYYHERQLGIGSLLPSSKLEYLWNITLFTVRKTSSEWAMATIGYDKLSEVVSQRLITHFRRLPGPI